MTIRYSQKSKEDIFNALYYIEQSGYPETAYKYGQRLKIFIESITSQTERFAKCRHLKFRERNFYCAIFESTYTIVFKIFKSSIHIHRVLHGKLIK